MWGQGNKNGGGGMSLPEKPERVSDLETVVFIPLPNSVSRFVRASTVFT